MPKNLRKDDDDLDLIDLHDNNDNNDNNESEKIDSVNDLDNGQHKKKSIKNKSISNNNTKRAKDNNLGAKESKNAQGEGIKRF